MNNRPVVGRTAQAYSLASAVDDTARRLSQRDTALHRRKIYSMSDPTRSWLITTTDHQGRTRNTNHYAFSQQACDAAMDRSRRMRSDNPGIVGETAPVHKSMTSAVVATGFGGPEVLSVIDDFLGEPKPGQVLIEVRAVGTNPVDYKMYSGAYGNDASQLPMHLGYEAAGVVSAVVAMPKGRQGPYAVGDSVIAYPVHGAYAAQLIAPASSVVPKPSTFSFEQAAGLLLIGTTAAHAVYVTGIGVGDTVVVHGASGGVGHVAVQLARNAGARVIAYGKRSGPRLPP